MRVCAGLLLLLAAAACRQTAQPAPLERATSERSSATAPAGQVATVAAKEADAREVGVVVARESVDVPARIEGVVAEIKVGRGDDVAAGDPLAVIDDRPIREELAIAQAGARAASAELSRARVAAAEARNRYRRRKGDAAAEVISAEERESAKFAAQGAQAAQSQAGANASEQRTRVQQLERMLEETTIVAPFSGKISDLYVQTGALVKRGAPVARLIAANELWLRFAVPTERRASYAVGATVDVAMESLGVSVEARVERISPDLDPVTQMVIAEARLLINQELTAKVQPGMAAWVRPGAAPAPLD